MDETANPGYLLETLETPENEIQRATQTWRVVRPREDIGGKWKRPLVECRASHMNLALPTKELRELGLVSFLEEFQRLKRSTG
jgi:hypothetical protein